MASAFEVHTASEMVCLDQAGKLRLAQEASARKLATTEGSAFVGVIIKNRFFYLKNRFFVIKNRFINLFFSTKKSVNYV